MSFRAWGALAALAACCACERGESDRASSGLGAVQQYRMVDELVTSDLSQWKGQSLKVHGWVLAGSIREQVLDKQLRRSFVLQKEGKKLRVFSSGPKPDTFRDQAEVVVSGRLVAAAEKRELAKALGVVLEADPAYVLDASELAAKCPSKYDGARPGADRGGKFE